VAVEQLPQTAPAPTPDDIRRSFVAGDPKRAGAFDRALIDAQARIAVHAYLTASGALPK
jgi:hypothetical protein